MEILGKVLEVIEEMDTDKSVFLMLAVTGLIIAAMEHGKSAADARPKQ